VDDEYGFGVPAGWYPDPLGLPQMRWWDNHGWTEYTTEARAPVVIQEAKLAWADDDPELEPLASEPAAPETMTRRELRERERTGYQDGGESITAPTAEALLELEPPSWDELPADEPSPAEFSFLVPTTATTAIQEPRTQSEYQQGVGNTPAVTPTTAAPAGLLEAPSTNSFGAWLIALMPLLQLVGILLVVSATRSTNTTVDIILSIVFLPYFVAIPCAISDRRALRRRGYDRTASWAWAFLTGPIYLIARAIRIVMRAGNGFAPILVWCALLLLQVGSIVAVPGLVISALPQAFSAQAAQSIAQSATVFGAIKSVSCPTPPATVLGQDFTCTLERGGSGEKFKVTAALVRENGWIAWQVHDWGGLTR
jgi:hypothetical protein